jgi:hypothetical protein
MPKRAKLLKSAIYAGGNYIHWNTSSTAKHTKLTPDSTGVHLGTIDDF